MNSAKERAIIRLKGFKNVNHIYKNSSDAIDEVPISDFIYIDGNHNYKFVKQDLNNYFNKVKIGGVFAGHDINKKEGVTKAVFEFIKQHNVIMNY